MLSDQLTAARRADFPIPKAQIPTFQYFWSELGLGWLIDSGEIDRKPCARRGCARKENKRLGLGVYLSL